MSTEKVKNLLKSLHDELENAEDVDQETLDLARALEVDVHKIIDTGEAEEPTSQMLVEMEARFAVEHPILERTFREIVNTLARMGI